MEKDQSEKWNEYQKKLSTNGKNSYPANDAEKEWRASKEAAEKYNMETVYTAKKNVDKYQENYERMESRLKQIMQVMIKLQNNMKMHRLN